MLYRNPEMPAVRRKARTLSLGWLTAFTPLRPRRVTELDLLSLSPHVRRDLGLLDADLAGLIGRK